MFYSAEMLTRIVLREILAVVIKFKFSKGFRRRISVKIFENKSLENWLISNDSRHQSEFEHQLTTALTSKNMFLAGLDTT